MLEDKLFQVVRMRGDGDCLFHALGFVDSMGGNLLRGTLVAFMREEATLLEPAEASIWTEEADALSGNVWGGHTAIMAYTKMRQRCVILHKRDIVGSMQLLFVKHDSVPGTAEVQHVLYTGGNHYDALLELSNIDGFEPAWEQNLPARYFVPSARNSVQKNASGGAGVEAWLQGSRLQAPLPKLKNKMRKGVGCSHRGDALFGADATETGNVLGASSRCKHPFYRTKTTPAPSLCDHLAVELARIPVRYGCDHPHRRQEVLIKAIFLNVVE